MQPPRQRRVARHVRVGAGEVLSGRDLVGGLEDLRRLAEVVTGPERKGVRLDDDGRPPVALRDPALGLEDRPVVEPGQKSEREEVLAPLGIAGLGTGRLARLEGERGHRDLVDPEGRQSCRP